jgi:hypothetical protein
MRRHAASILRRTARRLDPPQGEYLSAAATVAAAADAGKSVEEYVEELWGQVGSTTSIVARMSAVGALEPTDTVVEIGPGTGRYLARVREIVRPRRHVIYETAPDWRDWLTREYGVEAPKSSGESLSGIAEAGLIHAHGVFVYTPFLVTARYLAEIERIGTRWAVFDFYAVTEFGQAALDAWLRTTDRYPVVLERRWVLAQLPSFEVIDEWTSPHGHGESRYLALRRRGEPT